MFSDIVSFSLFTQPTDPSCAFFVPVQRERERAQVCPKSLLNKSRAAFSIEALDTASSFSK